MKAVLYNPKEKRKIANPILPFGLMVVGTSLKKEGWDVEIVDGRLGENIEDHLDGADMLGVTCMTSSMIFDAIDASKKAKKRNIKVVWGGFHPSLLPKQTLKNDFIDEIVIGKFRENEDIDYTILDIGKYVRKGSIDYLSSRGCPHRCGFCAVSQLYGRKFTLFPIEKIVNDLEYFVKNFNVKRVEFYDDNFYIDRKRTEKLMDAIIERKLNIKMLTMCRCDYFHRFPQDFILKLKQAGVDKFSFGAESGSLGILNYINKDIKPRDIVKAAKRCKEYGFDAMFSFIVGFPKETKEDREKTYKMIDKLHEIMKPEMRVFMYTPFPGTSLYKDALEKGFNEPTTLEGWAKTSYENPMNPWVPKELNDRFKCMTHITWFAFTPMKDSVENWTFTDKRLNKWYYRLAFKIFQKDAIFRWKHRLFGFAPEWKLFEKWVVQ